MFTNFVLLGCVINAIVQPSVINCTQLFESGSLIVGSAYSTIGEHTLYTSDDHSTQLVNNLSFIIGDHTVHCRGDQGWLSQFFIIL